MSDFPFKSFCKIAQPCRNNTKEKMFGKHVLVVDKSTGHDKQYFDFYAFMLFTTISTSKKIFTFRARAEQGIARHIDASGVVGIFNWLVLSMRMQVILDSSFARPGLAPIWGGKKGEFRDWTIHAVTDRPLFIFEWK